MSAPSKVPMPQAPMVDLQTGFLTRPWNNFFVNLTGNANAGAAGTVTTAPGSGLAGGGAVADGISLSIATNGVTNEMLRQSVGCSVVGRYAGSTGDVGDIQATADNRVLGRFGGELVFKDITLVPSVVADGNYGDITVSGTGTAWTINSTAVTFAKFQNISTSRLLGRNTAGTGSVEQITVGGGVEFTGTGGIQTSAFTGDATKAAGGTALTLATVNANTGTWGSATQAPVITLDGKGRATAASNVTITPAASSITGGQALTKADDTNVTLTLGGTPGTALLQAVSITAGWTGRLAYSRLVAATQKSLVGATAAGDFGEITLGSGVSITAGVLSATGTGGTVTSVSVVTANGFSGTVANASTTPAITLSYAGQALTKTDDTNVTLTLGGTPATALLAAASLTLGWTGQLSVARGGTSFSSYTTGDLIQASASGTLAKLAAVATGNVLISGGVGTVSSWGKVGLTTHVSGTLPIANGGTNQTSLGDITRTNDTNVTLTLGGAPAGAVITSTSFTLGWTGTLSVARGGTGGGSASGTLLDNITGFASTGLMARTGAGTYAFRTLTGTANEISVTNGDGVSANPTFSLPTALTFTGKTVTGGTYTGAVSYNAAASGTLTFDWGSGSVGEVYSAFSTTYKLGIQMRETGRDLRLMAMAGDETGIISFYTGSTPTKRGEVSNSGLAVGASPSYGGGAGVIFIANAGTNPGSNPSGGGVLYVDGGALKYKGSSGTVTTLGPA